jgi:UDP-galactose transporter
MLGGGKVHRSASARVGATTQREGSQSLKLLALLALVIQSVSLTMLMRYTRVKETEVRYLASTAVLLSECLKMAVCLFILWLRAGFSVPTFCSTLARDVLTVDAFKLVVPAFLYSIQNNLLYLALSNLDTATYNITYQVRVVCMCVNVLVCRVLHMVCSYDCLYVCVFSCLCECHNLMYMYFCHLTHTQLKTLTTAMFSRVMLKKRISKIKWLALLLLVAGVSMVQTHDNASMQTFKLQRERDVRMYMCVCIQYLWTCMYMYVCVCVLQSLDREAEEWERVRVAREEDDGYENEVSIAQQQEQERGQQEQERGQQEQALDEDTQRLVDDHNLQGPKIIQKRRPAPAPRDPNRPLSPREKAMRRKEENEAAVKLLLEEQREIDNELLHQEMADQAAIDQAELDRDFDAAVREASGQAPREQEEEQDGDATDASTQAQEADEASQGQPVKGIHDFPVINQADAAAAAAAAADVDADADAQTNAAATPPQRRLLAEEVAEGADVGVLAMGGHIDNRAVGFIAVLLCSFSSGFAGVYFEKVLKKSKTIVNVWARNVQLTFFGIVFSALLCLYEDSSAIAADGFLQGYTPMVWLVVVNNAVGGLVVALVVQHADQILKGFAMSVATIIVCVLSMYIWDFQVWVSSIVWHQYLSFCVDLYVPPVCLSHIHTPLRTAVLSVHTGLRSGDGCCVLVLVQYEETPLRQERQNTLRISYYTV